MPQKHSIECRLYRSKEGLQPYWFGTDKHPYGRYCRVKDIEEKFRLRLAPGSSIHVRITIEETE